MTSVDEYEEEVLVAIIMINQMDFNSMHNHKGHGAKVRVQPSLILSII